MSMDIVSTRLFAARPEAVFQAFMDPAVLARWWGPAGFTNQFEEFDPRPGGAWRLVMRGPDGTEYRMVKEFVEVVRGERIVLRHLDPEHGFTMTMAVAPEVGRTRLTWRMVFDSPEEAARVREHVVAANEQNLNRLAERLEERGGGPPGAPVPA